MLLWIGLLASLMLPRFALADSASTLACTNLTSALPGKIYYPLSLLYDYESTHYYDLRSAELTPACIVTPADASDVSIAIQQVRSFNSTFAVKSGGHNGNNDASLGWSATDGVLIDLVNMTEVTYVPETGSVFMGGGNRWLNVYETLQPFNVTAVGGRVSDVGVGGWSMGGGLSYLSAKYGLGVDTWKSLEVVLASGEIVNASATNDYSDLFAAMKGAGDTLGYVTTFEVAAIDIGLFWAGTYTVEGAYADQVIAAASNFATNYTDSDAAIIVTVENILAEVPLFLIFLVYNGPEPAQGVFDEFLSIPFLTDTTETRTYLSTATMADVGELDYNMKEAFFSIPISISNLSDAYSKYESWAGVYGLEYTLVSLDIQPIPKTLIERGVDAGGNLLFDGTEDNFIWLNLLIDWELDDDSTLMKAGMDLVSEIGYAPGLPIFLNDANWRQPVLPSYKNYDKLVAAKAKYDPDNFLATNTGGPSFS